MMGFGPELRLAEKPGIDRLLVLGCGYLPPPDTKEAVKGSFAGWQQWTSP
jgi:hypothetical protein